MPSNAYSEYLINLKDVNRLVADHRRQSSNNPGKRALGHLTRAGIVLLCAAWERYIESAIEETVVKWSNAVPSFSSMSADIQKIINDEINSGRNGYSMKNRNVVWKSALVSAAQAKTKALNTPKSQDIDSKLSKFIDILSISNLWTLGPATIDGFVTMRGGIAHNGGQAQYPAIRKLTQSISIVEQYVIDTDNGINNHIYDMIKKRIWRRIKK